MVCLPPPKGITSSWQRVADTLTEMEKKLRLLMITLQVGRVTRTYMYVYLALSHVTRICVLYMHACMHPQSSDSRMTLQEYEELLEAAQNFVARVREISGDEMRKKSVEDRKLLPKFMVREWNGTGGVNGAHV